MSEYQKQALDFLTKTNTSFTAEFHEFGKHFQDDKHERNIFNITLSNEKHKYRFKFGASINDSWENPSNALHEDHIEFYSGLKFEGLKREFLSYSDKIKIADLQNANTWNQCEKFIDKKKAETIYGDFVKANSSKHHRLAILSFKEWHEMIVQALVRKTTDLANKNWGIATQAKEIKYPSAYDVLTCLEKYPVTTFEDFCANYGYDVDSRKAYKTYKDVKREWENVALLFTEEELDLLREIQ